MEKAAENFQEVLDGDQKLMAELTEAKPSFYRRSLQMDFAAKAYELVRTATDTYRALHPTLVVAVSFAAAYRAFLASVRASKSAAASS